MRDIEFVKGHGTENDFVVLPDAEGVLDLTEPRVRALCDRSQGLGADGVLRVVRACALSDGALSDADGEDNDGWFMDYRNADGSVAEMCGNGVRVFARYLVEAGLAERGEFVIGTRNGPRVVHVREDLSVTVHMGQAKVFGRSSATVAGVAFDGVAIDVGNPHLVCLVDFDLATVDLTVPPGRDPALFPHGANVEFVREVTPDALRMRVHERGVGETRSCGTGTVAAVAATLHLHGRTSGRYTVDVPGGRVLVEAGEHGSMLTGPAVLVARGHLDAAWWDAAGS